MYTTNQCMLVMCVLLVIIVGIDLENDMYKGSNDNQGGNRIVRVVEMPNHSNPRVEPPYALILFPL